MRICVEKWAFLKIDKGKAEILKKSLELNNLMVKLMKDEHTYE